MADNNNLYTPSSSSSSSSPGHYSPGTATMSRSESGINKQPMIHDSLYCVDNPGGQITVNVDSYDRLTELTTPNSLGGKSNGEPISKESAEKHKDNADKLLDSLSGRGLQSVKSHAQLAKTAHGVRILAKNLNKATIHLQLGSIMIITKARDNSLVYLTRELAEWLLTKSSTVSVYVDYHLERSKRFDFEGLINDVPSASNRIKFWNKALIRESPDIFDLVVTLGGDGTVLYASTLFQRVVPPIMSFALGSLGFLTNFKFEDFRTIFTNMIIKGVHTNLRMRFTCRVHKANDDLVCEQQVLNELTIDRGPSPWVSMLELYGDGSLLTVAQADGLIIATPTGSTAYSLSAGGSLVHPSVSAISVTPICPHTLSFRPILLPDSMTLKVKVPQRSRATAWASFDGRSRIELLKGYYVTITASPFPFPTVRSSKNEYFDSVSRVLNWNSRDEQRSFVHLLSDKNRKSYATYQRRHGSTPESDYEEDDDTLEFLSGRDSAKFDKVKGVKPTFQINDQNIGNLVPHNLHAKTSSKLKNVLEFSDSDSPSGKESSKELSDSDTGIDDTKDADEGFEIDYNDEQMPDCGDSGNKDAVSLSDSTVDIDDKEEDYHNNYFFPTSSESLRTPLVISDTSSIVGGLGPYVAENSSKLQNVESDHSRSFGKELAKQLHNLSMRDKEK